MHIRLFAHSWLSDWNHGNAHFLRGWASALIRRGHHVRAYEPVDTAWGGWSLSHLWAEPAGPAAVRQMRAAYPELDIHMYAPPELAPSTPANYPIAAATACPWVQDWDRELRGAELVLVHEWNPPALFELLLQQRRRHGFRLLLHDTHHRALSQEGSIRRLPLSTLDGVIAFGESLRRVYERWGARRSYTLHEAADVYRFRPRPAPAEWDLVWIGNWGDGERSRELEEFLLVPALGLRARAHGVRYPAAARARLAAAGIGYGGYLANLDTPAVYARSQLSVHIPRRMYGSPSGLPGIPTIRVFEALACGAALLCAPWTDEERLFTPGADYALAASGAEMSALCKQLLTHPEQRTELGKRGAATVAARHTCDHRAQELETICADLN